MLASHIARTSAPTAYGSDSSSGPSGDSASNGEFDAVRSEATERGHIGGRVQRRRSFPSSERSSGRRRMRRCGSGPWSSVRDGEMGGDHYNQGAAGAAARGDEEDAKVEEMDVGASVSRVSRGPAEAPVVVVAPRDSVNFRVDLRLADAKK